ncbi:MAG: hypothetical protein CM1200mP16_07690 [Nitrospina sp.]|nr:MAG: hypothetical protein CM1200mP16_07690 [Nitrospina sp.]
MTVKAQGDTQIDFHHTVEDVGIAVGQAFKEALGEKKGIRRFAEASTPLNEALAQWFLTLADGLFLYSMSNYLSQNLGDFDVELVSEFFQAFSANSGTTLHLNSPYWSNLHHIIEALFKAFARALDSACSIDSRTSDIPSTKGTL